MAKMSSYEKQDRVINQFEAINRKAKWEERNPHKRDLTQVEKAMIQSRKRNEEYRKKLEKNPPKPFISHYNPDNPLNGSSSWNREQRAAYAAQVKAQKKLNKQK